MKVYGLIGYPLSHSFSAQYFTEKFDREGIKDARYALFTLQNIADFPNLLDQNPALRGLNVTTPHKEAVIDYLDALDPAAEAVGAVNVIRFSDGRLIGYNSDILGLERSLQLLDNGKWLQPTPKRALILGTGGAAKAVAYVLDQAGIDYAFVSRTLAGENILSYTDLRQLDFEQILLIFNATPVGTYPDIDKCPDLPYERLHAAQLVYDLVYNPAETLLLQRAKEQGAFVKNGLDMLHLQAEAAWMIWQNQNH